MLDPLIAELTAILGDNRFVLNLIHNYASATLSAEDKKAYNRDVCQIELSTPRVVVRVCASTFEEAHSLFIPALKTKLERLATNNEESGATTRRPPTAAISLEDLGL